VALATRTVAKLRVTVTDHARTSRRAIAPVFGAALGKGPE